MIFDIMMIYDVFWYMFYPDTPWLLFLIGVSWAKRVSSLSSANFSTAGILDALGSPRIGQCQSMKTRSSLNHSWGEDCTFVKSSQSTFNHLISIGDLRFLPRYKWLTLNLDLFPWHWCNLSRVSVTYNVRQVCVRSLYGLLQDPWWPGGSGWISNWTDFD